MRIARGAATAKPINGTAFVSAAYERAAPVHACRIEDGRARTPPRPIGGRVRVFSSVASPSGGHALYGVFRGTQRPVAHYYLLSAAATGGSIRPAPEQGLGYSALSPGGRFAATFFRGEAPETRLSVYRTDTWREVWSGVGAAFPVWDASGTRLVFARFLDREGAGTRPRYWRAGHGFPPAFYQQDRAARLRDTDLFAAELAGPNRTATVRRITGEEAARLAGGWHPAFLRLCLGHDSLIQPHPGQVLVAPGGRGVLFDVSWDRRAPWIDPDTGGEVPHTHPEASDMKTYLVHVDAQGRVYRHPEPGVRAACWSRDGRHVYGTGGTVRTPMGWELRPHRLIRMDARTGRQEGVALPERLYWLLAFVEG